MKTPKISVIMPVFNGEKYLKEAIDSILRQSFFSFELLVIDDYSTDNTAEILNSYDDKRIKVLTNETNKGVSYSRNKALKEAQGEYIALMDADDIAVLDRLQIQYDFMEKNRDVGVCGGCVKLFGSERGVWFPSIKHDDIKVRFLFSSNIYNPTAFIRKGVILEKNQYYNTDYHYGEDYEFWMRLLLLGVKFENINKVLTKYRRHISNASLVKFKQSNTEKTQYLILYKLNIKNIKKKAFVHGLLASGRNLKIEDYKKVTAWIEELIIANKQCKIFDEDSLKKEIGRRWFRMCYKSCKNGLKTFTNYKEAPAAEWYKIGYFNEIKFFVKSIFKI